MQTLNTPLDFFNHVVRPDFEALEKNTTSARLLFHAATSIHHLREWVFKANDAVGKATPPELCKDCAEKRKEFFRANPNSYDAFNKNLYESCPALKKIRDLASNAKHFPPDSAEKLTVTHTAEPATAPIRPLMDHGEPAIAPIRPFFDSGGNVSPPSRLADVTATNEDGVDIQALQAIREGFEFWKKKVENGELGLRVSLTLGAPESP
ncbi:hypothetical protein [Caballeronia novacaledonica]|uniref:Uncharacterized protein n=1 Tax=Caballeronia novacaledonica TaxID=1544861 RepID=A0AA37IK57_9BURK|nr:hypothetical protein [Caballeronia novacaledonica]GJH30228.1 hypothetical protein CBA19CS42_36950 [Caballeronia novacaledonica]